ncbi:MAG: hypothetical protein Q7S50_00940 [bacterium]|nr:hypothetical protein [bacterium]
MAKDYFQDIIPPAGDSNPRPLPSRLAPQASLPIEEPLMPEQGAGEDVNAVPIHVGEPQTPRSIRNISGPIRQRSARAGMVGGDMRESAFVNPPPKAPRSFSNLWIWALAILSFLVLAGLLLFAFRSTTVTVTPKSQTLTLNNTVITAFPAESATSGMLLYTVQGSDLEDSEVVPAKGSTHVEDKASGSITVYNDYSTASQRLIKNTRFETPDGLVFRTPADIVVPGKRGTVPGQVNVTIIADQAGEKYNIGAIARFTLPGLKSSPDMYAKIYAKSSVAMTGGFVGEQPGTEPGALDKGRAAIRSRFQDKANEAAAAKATSDVFALPAALSYQSLPNTTEAGGSVRIHEKAHVEIILLSVDAFAQAVAQSSSANIENGSMTLKTNEDFVINNMSATSSILGTDSLHLSVSGTALLVWKVDAGALAAALAGRDQGAFQTIVNGFSSIQEANARIEPFWKNSFPANAEDIKVKVVEPNVD